jgi:hypothetical protein
LKRSALVLVFFAVSLLGVVLWVNYTNLVEAYGDGPPYYGRTTNMDKWSDPLPALVVVDLLVLVLIGLILGVIIRKRRRSPLAPGAGQGSNTHRTGP